MNIKNKTVGIWGYGVVGQSAAQFFASREAKIVIFDDKRAVKQAPSFTVHTLESLFQADYLLPSPGIDTSAYRSVYTGKWLNELDIFQTFFTKKIIAITGSVGKTTITYQLMLLLKQGGWRVETAGNIGTPCLGIIDRQSELDAVVLEVSSFQLEYCQSFAPDLAIWTNFYPNHLDRHVSMDQYFAAKYNLIKHQRSNQQVIAPTDLTNKIRSLNPHSIIHSFDPAPRSSLFTSGFPSNNALLEKALELLHVSPRKIDFPELEHRLEKVATINDVTFYNDSKSTTPASTLAAIEQLEQYGSRIVLFLGGLSKGIDRSYLIQSLRDKNMVIFCFGREAAQLHDLCISAKIPAFTADSLSKSMALSHSQLKRNDIVLLSPAGSSFDEFKNYEDRGTFFKELIMRYQKSLLRNP